MVENPEGLEAFVQSDETRIATLIWIIDAIEDRLKKFFPLNPNHQQLAADMLATSIKIGIFHPDIKYLLDKVIEMGPSGLTQMYLECAPKLNDLMDVDEVRRSVEFGETEEQ